MKRMILVAAALVMLLQQGVVAGEDPLPSWNDTPTKKAIVEFVNEVTLDAGGDYVAPEQRIAVFDNDGTLWCEQPMYFQLLFAIDRVKAMAAEGKGGAEWKEKEPFASILKGDTKAALAGGEHAILEIIAATHAGMSTDEFHDAVYAWIRDARHPTFKRPYNQCVYQPMLELLAYLRSKGFKTFIVSGGGVEFMRAFAQQTYGIPPEQIVGSSGVVKFEMKEGKPVLMKEPKVEFIDDGPGKPVGINRFIGRRPVMAFGNSDGDLQMLQWTTSAAGKRFGLIVHHTDGEREFAYDRQSHIGKLDKALDEANAKGWTVVDMKTDWKVIFPLAK